PRSATFSLDLPRRAPSQPDWAKCGLKSVRFAVTFRLVGYFRAPNASAPRSTSAAKLWISESFGRHLPPVFWSALTFPLGLRLAMIQRFLPKAQRVAVFGGGLGT